MEFKEITSNIKARISIAEKNFEEVEPKGLADLNEYFTGYIAALKTLLKDLEESCVWLHSLFFWNNL